MSSRVIEGLLRFKGIFVFVFLVLTVISVLSCVSAASLTVDEVGYGSSAVKNYTETHSNKIPSYVKVNGKNSTAPSFLNTLTKTVVQVNQNVETPVTISSVGAAPNPSGSATGNLSKSEYITIAGDVKSFIGSNGRAPNYAASSKGNIRYQSLVYMYARIMRYYHIYKSFPNTINIVNIPGTSTGGVNIQDTTRPTVSSVDPANNKVITVADKALVITFSENIKAGSAFSNIKVTNPDGVAVNPLYKVINGKTLTLTRNGYYINGLTYTITLPTGSITDTASNAITTFTSKFTVDFVKPTVTSVDPANNKIINVANKAIVITFSENIKAGSAFSNIKVTNPDGVSVNPLYKVINGKTLTLTRNGNYINGLNYTITLPTGSITDTAGNTLATVFTSKFTVDNTKPTVSSVDPANNKVITAADKALVITFSENIKAGSAFSNIKVTNPDGVAVNPLYKVINGKTLTLTRNGYYINGLTYTTTLPTGSITDTAGNTLAAAFTSKFTVDFAKPTVTSVDPANNKIINVANKALVITFSENIKAGSAFTSIKVTNPDGVAVNPLYKVINGKTLTLTRNGYYINGLTYTTTLPTGSITDQAGNTLATAFTSKFTIDTTKPTVTTNLASGVYNTTKSVTLTATDNVDSNPSIYYTTNGSNPTISSTRYTTPITISLTTTLKFIARDSAGNIAAVQSRNYIIDTPPIVTANTGSGVFNTTQNVTLTAMDNIDPNPIIYYTTNGSDPTTSSTRYTTPISIFTTTTLKFMARDSVGKQSPIQTVYYIFSQVGNINTGKGYTSIQTAVSDSLTLNGHIIEVLSGTYTENIIVNKKLIIRPTYNGDVTVQAADPSLSVFTVNSGGSGSIIQGFTIIGANQTNELGEPLNPAGIHLKSTDNCTIINNTIKNNYYGVYLLDSSYNQVDSNVIMNNVNGVFVPAWCVSFEEYYSSTYLSDPEIFDYVWWEYNEYYFGMHSDSFYNKITQNSIRNNTKGVYITSDLVSDDSGSRDTQVLENDITSNNIGIYADCTNANIHFNRITGNNNSGLYMYVGAVDATDNWWGSNSPVINTNYSWWSNSDTCDIYYEDYESSQSFKPPSWILMEKFTPYLVLKVKPTSHKVSNGKVYESTITTDLTHNSAGEYTSSKGHVPDGIPTHFSTNKGTITNLSYIKNSKASSRLILDPNLQSGMTTITTTIDRQGVSTQVDRIAKAIINIISTATDTSTNQPLNLTYTIPLNESVSWVSVLWKENTNVTDPFKNKLEVIVNGKVVQSKVFTNSAYSYIKDYYSGTYGFIFFEAISSINRFLANVDDINSEEAQLFLGIYRAMLTTEDFNFIMNNRLYFTDEIHITLSYPGDSSQIINIDPGDGSNMINLGFGGNPIQRTSTVLYRNGGYQHCLGDPYDPNATFESREAGYEGVRSFAIVTTKVTDNILQYWLNEKDKKDANGKLLYPTGPMKAAYGTFLTSLLMIKAHDMVADAAATKFNVTWSRTTPIIVSVLDDSYDGYLTLECDHRFGMDVTGDPNNVIAFRFTCSAAINPIEYWVMKTLFPSVNSTLDDLSELCSSITIGLGQKILNGEMVDIFISNGYLVMKSTENDLFLVFDPETGIVRDVMINNSIFSYSTWCYSDQQTEWVRDLGESILDYGRNIMNILINGGGIIDLNQLATNTKNGLTGLISSSILSLERATIFLENNIPSYLLTPLLGFNMINLCCYNAIIIREEPYVVENIVGYLNSKKKYLVEDGVDVILFGASIVGTTLVSRMGIIGIVYTGCELLNDFRDHYVPMEYWQFFHHPKIWETKTYTLCHLDSSSTPIWDEPTINVEVPYKGDGSLDWDNAVYIHSVTGARKVNSTQLKELTNGYWWNNPPYFGFTQCPIP